MKTVIIVVVVVIVLVIVGVRHTKKEERRITLMMAEREFFDKGELFELLKKDIPEIDYETFDYFYSEISSYFKKVENFHIYPDDDWHEDYNIDHDDIEDIVMRKAIKKKEKFILQKITMREVLRTVYSYNTA